MRRSTRLSATRWASSRINRSNFTVSKNDLRSEEHTSELQSLRQLVCRLLLGKNNVTLVSVDDRPKPQGRVVSAVGFFVSHSGPSQLPTQKHLPFFLRVGSPDSDALLSEPAPARY